MPTEDAMAGATADWGGLEGRIDGRVVLPGAPDFNSARKSQMARFDAVLPAAVVLCASSADVAATVAFARQHGLPMAVRGGGHSVAGRSSTDGVIVDVGPMDSVAVEADLVRVGAGVRLGGLYDVVHAHSRAVPAGCSHSVGIAGLTLGGGIGILGRRHGLTCDRLERAEVVLADGRVVECDEDRHDDLFWALRGAGGGQFGVVTALALRTVSAPVAKVFHLVWPFEHARALIRAWQRWAPTGPDELDATLRLSATGGAEAPPVVDLFGVLLGSEADIGDLLGDLVAQVGADPTTADRRQVSYRDAKRYLDGLGPSDRWRDEPPPPPPRDDGHVFTKSELFQRPMPDEAIDALVEHFAPGPIACRAREVTFLPWGGAYNRVPADATAFAHRDALFLVQHLLVLDPGTDRAASGSARDWLAGSWALVRPWGSGAVYPNFPDPDLADWGRAYYGANYERLRQIKARYDPDGVFRFHQSIPPA
jgi:FAD/FMN-containing dehydrogenase